MRWDLLVIANPAWETAFLVDRIAEDSGPAPAGAAVSDGGGSALNTACALAVAGRRVLAVGRVGDDDQGRACLEALRRRGVETACAVLPGRTTKRNTCLVERDTQATAFVTELPERSVPPWEDRPAALLEAQVLVLDRLAAAAPGWLRERGRAAGGRPPDGSLAPVLGPAPANALVRNSAILSPTGRERYREALPCIAYLQVPEDPEAEEADPLASALIPDPSTTPASPSLERGRLHRPRAVPLMRESEATAILSAGVRILVRTRGPRGALAHVAGRPVLRVPAVPTRVVDPTGAGDAFAAGFLHALLDGLPLEAAGALAADWASRACRHLGARAWLDHEPPIT